MADRPLKPATDRRLGGPLPHQLPNRTRVHPSAINLSPDQKARAYAVLAPVSRGCPPPKGRSPRVTHPSAALHPAETGLRARLACVKPAASVRPEPGSNSQVSSQPPGKTQTQTPRPHTLLGTAEPRPGRSPGTQERALRHLRQKRNAHNSSATQRRRPRFPSQFSTLSKNSWPGCGSRRPSRPPRPSRRYIVGASKQVNAARRLYLERRAGTPKSVEKPTYISFRFLTDSLSRGIVRAGLVTSCRRPSRRPEFEA